jgi:hypothetical protein
MDPKIKLKLNPKGNQGDKSNTYAQLLGELKYIANAVRPNIVGSKSVAMFFSFRLFAVWHFMEWKSHLAL